MKVSVSKCLINGKDSRWRVRWHELGRVHRKFFTGRDGADTFAIQKRGESTTAGQRLITLPQTDQELLLAVHDEAGRRGISLMALLEAGKEEAKKKASPALIDVLEELLAVKGKGGGTPGYVYHLRRVLTAFAQGRERMPVNNLTLHDVEKFLESKNIRSRSTLRARLSTLFGYCVRRGYCDLNP